MTDWTKKLNEDPGVPQPNPRLLDGQAASYQIFIKHVLPDPVPQAAKQVWQVVGCHVLKVDRECKISFDTDYTIDIVKLRGQTEIADSLARIWHEDLCFALEACFHTIGFDDGKSDFKQQTNVSVTKQLAEKTRDSMTGPKGTFWTFYYYYAPDCDCDLGFFTSFPRGEYLWVGGIGVFPKVPEAPKEEGLKQTFDHIVHEKHPRERLLSLPKRKGLSMGIRFNAETRTVDELRTARRRVKRQ